MSVTIGAALKKIAVALLADRKNWEKLAVALFAVLLLFLLPILSVEAIFQADMDWDSPELVSAVLEELDVGSLGFLESSNNILTQLQNALKEAGFGFDEFRKAQALYWLALSPFSEESDFIEKLVGCFAPDQTNEELVANVNAAFGTDIDPEEFRKFWPPPPAIWWPSPRARSGRPAASPTGLGTASAPGWNGAPFLSLGAPTSAATSTRASSPSSPAAA